MLPHLYKDFSKDFFATFAVSVVDCAKAGDALSKHVIDASAALHVAQFGIPFRRATAASSCISAGFARSAATTAGVPRTRSTNRCSAHSVS